MTIKTRLNISMIIELTLVVVVGLVLVWTLRATSQANTKNVRATNINEAITELRFLTFENLLNHNERSLEQWQLKHQSLAALLRPEPPDNPAERRLLADISSQHQGIKNLFDRLVASYQDTAVPSAGAAPSAYAPTSFQERVVGQLLVKQQAQITQAGQLAALSRAEITAQQIKSFWIVLGAIVLMLLVTAANAWFVTATITSSLARLQQGAAAIAGGDLGYRIHHPRRDEFGRLATAFNAMAASLKQADQTKSEFILMVSHQLRTPATAVKGFLSLLLDGYQGRLASGQTETLQAAFAENERQLQLVDQMLVVAQAETGQMVLSTAPTDLRQIIQDIVTAQAPRLKDRMQTITISQPQALPQALVDPDKLRLALENLIANASDYSPSHQSITVELTHSATELVIAVKDHGFGIAKSDQAKLFKKFSRLSNTGATRIDGAGLGLYLAKKIVNLHGGRISVNSKTGQGSTFTVHLPAPPQKGA